MQYCSDGGFTEILFKGVDPINMQVEALSDVRVLELGQLLAGPFCGQLLADFGAEVLKIEDPGKGDPMREWGREKPHGKSLWWPVVARGKKSVTINLRSEEGQELVRELVKSADVLIENFRPGTLEKWDLSYETLSKINPRLVLTRVTGYGQTGPYASKAGYGAIGEAMGGVRYVTGDPSHPPSRAGISLGDSLAAIFAAYGTLVALHSRDRTGQGQVVDAAIYEAVLSMMESLIPEYSEAGYIRERSGAIIPNVAPSNVYPTKDAKMILIAANQDTVFARLANAMGHPEHASDERFATHSARGRHQELLDQMISSWTQTMDVEELERTLDAFAIPQGKIYRAPEMLEDPHFEARGNIITLPHKVFGQIKMHNVAPRLSTTPGYVRWAGPDLGEHNKEVFSDLLNLTEARQEELRLKGVI